MDHGDKSHMIEVPIDVVFAHPGRGACHVESGAPVTVTEANGKVTLVGVVSFGTTKRCSGSGFEWGLTKLDLLLDWLESIIGPQCH